jgi:hypothetical protein
VTSSENRHPTRLLRAALSAAAAGFHVFPVAPRGKTPAVKDWENQATGDRHTITGWWRARPYNVGLAVARSGIVVLDLDDARGQQAPPPWTGATGGRDVLGRLAAAAGQPFPDDTYTVRTPSGGEHLYFRALEGVELRNTAGTLGWRIDTRAHGGFVVGAGSVRDEGRYRVTRDAPIAPLPGWLAEALTAPHATQAGLLPAAELRLTPQRAQAYLRAITEGETRAVTTLRPANVIARCCAPPAPWAGSSQEAISPNRRLAPPCSMLQPGTSAWMAQPHTRSRRPSTTAWPTVPRPPERSEIRRRADPTAARARARAQHAARLPLIADARSLHSDSAPDRTPPVRFTKWSTRTMTSNE